MTDHRVTLSARLTPFFRRRATHLRQILALVPPPGTKRASREWCVRIGKTHAPTEWHEGELWVEIDPIEQRAPLTIALMDRDSELATATVWLEPVPRFTILIGGSSHTDIGYTDWQERVKAIQCENLDRSLALAQDHPHFKFNAEVSWQVEQYRLGRTATQLGALYELARRNRIGVGALYTNFLTGLMSHEAICRIAQHAASLRPLGVTARCAVITDVPTAAWTLPMILKQSGVRALLHGINNWRAEPWHHTDQLGPMQWEAPDGTRLPCFATRWPYEHYPHGPGYAQANTLGLFGRPANLRVADVEAAVELYLHDNQHRAVGDTLYAHGACFDNQSLDARLPQSVLQFNEHYEYPRLVLATHEDYLTILERYASDLRIVRGDGGFYWEDGAASTAHETALLRRTLSTLQSAERLLALASPAFPSERVADAWHDLLLFLEHTFGAASSIKDPEGEANTVQWQNKRAFIVDADRKSRALLAESLADLGHQLSGDPSERVLVFNDAPWPRAGIIEVALADDVEILCDGRALPRECGPRGVRVELPAIPALGHRSFATRRGSRTAVRTIDAQHIEARHFTADIDQRTGALASLRERASGRELVARARHSLGEFVYVQGGERSRVIASDWVDGAMVFFTDPPQLIEHRPELDSVRAFASDLGITIESRAHAPRIPGMVTRFCFPHHTPEVEITIAIDKQRTYDKEAGYIALPFAFTQPRVILEIPCGHVDVATEMLPGACHEWYCAQHWIELSEDDRRVVVSTPDAPLFTMGDVFRGAWRDRLERVSGILYSYVLNNYWPTNYQPGQGGALEWRYVIGTGPVARERFGWNACHPLRAAHVRTGGGARPDSGSWLALDRAEGVIVTAITRDAKSVVVRLLETRERPAEIVLKPALFRFARAEITDLVDEARFTLPVMRDGSVMVPLQPRSLVSVRLS